jgi:thiamine-monophosphate kinase
VLVEVEKIPLSMAGQTWLEARGAPLSGRLALAAGGDDYEIVCAVAEDDAGDFAAACRKAGLAATRVGRFQAGAGIRLTYEGMHCAAATLGYRHR